MSFNLKIEIFIIILNKYNIFWWLWVLKDVFFFNIIDFIYILLNFKKYLYLGIL